MTNISQENQLPIFEAQGMNIAFDQKKVVSDLSFSIKQGEIFCLVGESGSGKSITALSILKLLPEYAEFSAQKFQFKQDNLMQMPEKDMRTLRGKKISMIFQEPMTSLNPVLKISHQVMETIQVHHKLSKAELKSRCEELLKSVGISPERMNDYPHQLSGGMRQRVMIAIALACSPDLLIADEPTTALDVTIQGQILSLLKNLVKERNMSLLFITHDLGIVSEIADTVAVMYAGELMELAPVKDFFQNPLHPYSKALMACIPRTHTASSENLAFAEKLPVIQGSVPMPEKDRTTCAFLPRCPQANPQCQKNPSLTHAQNAKVRCVLYSAE